MIARTVSLLGNGMCQAGTTTVQKGVLNAHFVGAAVDINCLFIVPGDLSTVVLKVDEGGPVESNERYYRRRAVEERMAAQRAVTEQARAWHAKLAEDFAARAINCTAVIISQTAVSA